jgi:hypothetical protein
LNRQTLQLDRTDGLVHFFSAPRRDLLLLVLQQGEHFAVLFQFLAQGSD